MEKNTNDLAQIIREICGIPIRQIFNTKKACFSSKSMNKIQLPHQFWAKILVSFDFEFFSQTVTTTPDIRYDIGGKQSPEFPFMNKSTLGKWSKKYGFCYKWYNEKMRVSLFFSRYFIKSSIPALVFSCEFLKTIQPATLLETILRNRCFPMNFSKLLRTLILQNICKGLLLI